MCHNYISGMSEYDFHEDPSSGSINTTDSNPLNKNSNSNSSSDSNRNAFKTDSADSIYWFLFLFSFLFFSFLFIYFNLIFDLVVVLS